MDPTTNPTDPNALALSIFNAVMNKQWRMLAALALIVTVSLLKWAAPKISDRFAFFKTDRGGAVIVLVLSELGAVATALMAKAPLTTELFVTALSTGFMAAGGYVVIKRIFWPTDVKVAAAAKASAVKAGSIGIILFGTAVAGSMLASCACWEPSNPAYSTPKCIIARKVVQCGSQGISAALAQTLANAPTQDWANLISNLEADGGTTAGCLLADLPSVFASKMGASPMAATYSASAKDLFAAYRKKHGYDDVKFCFNTADGKQECR